jgi:hypothetical protein
MNRGAPVNLAWLPLGRGPWLGHQFIGRRSRSGQEALHNLSTQRGRLRMRSAARGSRKEGVAECPRRRDALRWIVHKHLLQEVDELCVVVGRVVFLALPPAAGSASVTAE